MACCGFFLAVNAIPPLLIQKHFGYSIDQGRASVFFYPAFYFHEIIPKYILSPRGFVNWVGDVMAFGFFPALGTVLCMFRVLCDDEAKKNPEQSRGRWIFLLLYLTFALVTAAALFLLFSRGTMTCFGFVLLFFVGMVGFKAPFPGQRYFVLFIFLAVVGFIVWGGNFNKAWKEIQTLQEEADPVKRRSFTANIEGAQRARHLHEEYPVLGTGTHGYRKLSSRYASRDIRDEIDVVASSVAMNHYLQVWAEEGAGAYLYFLMLLAYIGEMLWGIWNTKSSFKFIAALSLFSPVLMVLMHASFNDLMEHFSITLMVCVAMGASLGVLRKDFRHEE